MFKKGLSSKWFWDIWGQHCFSERKTEAAILNEECQPHLSTSWNFPPPLSLLIHSTSFEHVALSFTIVFEKVPSLDSNQQARAIVAGKLFQRSQPFPLFLLQTKGRGAILFFLIRHWHHLTLVTFPTPSDFRVKRNSHLLWGNGKYKNFTRWKLLQTAGVGDCEPDSSESVKKEVPSLS